MPYTIEEAKSLIRKYEEFISQWEYDLEHAKSNSEKERLQNRIYEYKNLINGLKYEIEHASE